MKTLIGILIIIACFITAAHAQEPVRQESGWVYACGAHVPIKYAKISAASSGDNTLVAAVASKRIRVLDVLIVATDAVTVSFESDASGTALTGDISLAANGGFAPGFDLHGHFQTVAGELLNLELGGAVQVDGWLTYIETSC